jgi:hypothetical protein
MFSNGNVRMRLSPAAPNPRGRSIGVRRQEWKTGIEAARREGAKVG